MKTLLLIFFFFQWILNLEAPTRPPALNWTFYKIDFLLNHKTSQKMVATTSFHPYYSVNISNWATLLKFGVPDHSDHDLCSQIGGLIFGRNYFDHTFYVGVVGIIFFWSPNWFCLGLCSMPFKVASYNSWWFYGGWVQSCLQRRPHSGCICISTTFHHLTENFKVEMQ